ncbi:hypothetical protein DY000_02007083 [Brassica cretica]|uniref:Uncharacterized protein n=1 Tax=Brassica cretica TaxID=69181 RepID=A0ABQ7C0X2_BRACR|nr:hypothetical protein DY000_02007083 [Brassica cretica]
MTNASIFLSNLKTGQCSSTVQVRLIRFWEARSGKLMGVENNLIPKISSFFPWLSSSQSVNTPKFLSDLKSGRFSSIVQMSKEDEEMLRTALSAFRAK